MEGQKKKFGFFLGANYWFIVHQAYFQGRGERSLHKPREQGFPENNREPDTCP